MSNVHEAVGNLFFGHQHGNFGAVGQSVDVDYHDEAHRAALTKDAENFIEALKPVCSVDLPSADDLVTDFYERIG